MVEKKVSRKPRKCPVCNGRVVPVYYGIPPMDAILREQQGDLVLGGCCVKVDEYGNEISPSWECIQCHTKFVKM